MRDAATTAVHGGCAVFKCFGEVGCDFLSQRGGESRFDARRTRFEGESRPKRRSQAGAGARDGLFLPVELLQPAVGVEGGERKGFR